MNTKFKKNQFVKCNDGQIGKIITVNVNKNSKITSYLVKNKWYLEDELVRYIVSTFTPTNDQLAIIKKEYPLFSRSDIQILKENRTSFIFRYNKNGQRGILRYIKGEFKPIKMDKVIELCIC